MVPKQSGVNTLVEARHCLLGGRFILRRHASDARGDALLVVGDGIDLLRELPRPRLAQGKMLQENAVDRRIARGRIRLQRVHIRPVKLAPIGDPEWDV